MQNGSRISSGSNWRGAIALALVLPGASLSARACAQSERALELDVGEIIQLPSASNSADHATLAANDRGDFFVAWSSHVRAPGGGSTRQVEGVFLQRTTPFRWSVSGPYLLGDAFVDPVTVARCHKPDVEAFGDDFVVVWPRISDPTDEATIEAAWVDVDALGVLGAIQSEKPGRGWRVGPAVLREGEAGVMPDVVVLDGGAIGVAFAELEPGTGEYVVSWTVFDEQSLDQPTSHAYQRLVSGIRTHTATGGGKVLPDVVRDDGDRIHVAYESLATSVDALEIHVDEFQYDPQTRLLTATDTWSTAALHTPELDVDRRRAMLDADPADGRSEVRAAWGILDDRAVVAGAGRPAFDVESGVLDPTSGSRTWIADAPFVFDRTSWHPSRPVPVQRGGVSARLSDLLPVLDGSPQRSAIVVHRYGGNPELIEVADMSVKRPAVGMPPAADVLGLTFDAKSVSTDRRTICMTVLLN